jgi:predicted DNA-binding transcriptional regulator AlpA
MPAATMTTAEVADLLGIAPATLLAKREELADATGFPEPLPWSLRPLRWRRDRIEAWLGEQGLSRAAPVPARVTGPNVVLLAEARRA